MADTIPNAQQRLRVLQLMCEGMASDILNTHTALCNAPDDEALALLVADALERLGWLADQAAVVAGCPRPPIGGGARFWMLGPAVRDELAKIEEATND